MIGIGSTSDPFVFPEYPPQAGTAGIGNSNTAGKTLQSWATIKASVTIKVGVLGGQSNMATAPGSTLYTTVSALAINLSIYDGGPWSGSDPILGCSNAPGAGGGGTGLSSVCMRLMDRIISQGKATCSIGVPIAMGGTPFIAWVPGNSAGLFLRVSAAILRCRARGLEPDYIIWGQGETDNTLATSAASITASINAIVDGIRAMGCVAPFYVGKYTMVGGAVSATIQTGIANSITGATGRNIFAGYDADTNCTVAGGFRCADGTHLSDTGLVASANGWQGIIFP